MTLLQRILTPNQSSWRTHANHSRVKSSDRPFLHFVIGARGHPPESKQAFFPSGGTTYSDHSSLGLRHSVVTPQQYIPMHTPFCPLENYKRPGQAKSCLHIQHDIKLCLCVFISTHSEQLLIRLLEEPTLYTSLMVTKVQATQLD